MLAKQVKNNYRDALNDVYDKQGVSFCMINFPWSNNCLALEVKTEEARLFRFDPLRKTA